MERGEGEVFERERRGRSEFVIRGKGMLGIRNHGLYDGGKSFIIEPELKHRIINIIRLNSELFFLIRSISIK